MRDVHNHITKSSDNLGIPNFRKPKTRRNIFCKGLESYNELPNYVKNEINSIIFKYDIAEHCRIMYNTIYP